MHGIKGIVKVGLGGVVITLLSGLARNTPPGLVGASWYGYPTVWLYKLVLAPQYFPWKVNVLNLIIDIIFWAIILTVLVFIASKCMPGKPAKAARKKPRKR